MDRALVGRTYLGVVRDLAASDFARRRRLTVQPMPYHLEELAAIATKLPRRRMRCACRCVCTALSATRTGRPSHNKSTIRRNSRHLGHHHEYTGEELRWVLEHCGFEAIEPRYLEDTLRRKGIIGGLGDIKRQDRLFHDYWRGRAGWSPYELARLFPHMGSVLLATARKPA